MPYTIVGGEEIEAGQWAVSLILNSNHSHAYVVIEGFEEDVEEKRVAKEAHLGFKWRDEQKDERYAEISFVDTDSTRLEHIARHCKARTWIITKQQKDTLEAAIRLDVREYKENDIPYVKAGASKISGSLGATLDASGLTEVKETSIQALSPLAESKNPFVQNVSYPSADSLLRKGHNCASWAKSKVKLILGSEYQEKIMSALADCVIVHPRNVVESHGATCYIL